MSKPIDIEAAVLSPEVFINRELSWLQFARRVLAIVADQDEPLLERVKFLGILGMLHDEFFMKRVAGLKRQVEKGVNKQSLDGLSPAEELAACRAEVVSQHAELDRLVTDQIRPSLATNGLPIHDYDELGKDEQRQMRKLFSESVLPTLTPLAVDAEHPFPFISGLGLNLAVVVDKGKRERFVRLKVPTNLKRWVSLEPREGFVPLEQVIAANLDLLFPKARKITSSLFRVTRAARGEQQTSHIAENGAAPNIPGSIISLVTDELKARKFAGEVRLQVAKEMPEQLRQWLCEQLGLTEIDLYESRSFLRLADFLHLQPSGFEELRHRFHDPVTHPRLRCLEPQPESIFSEIKRGDVLLHHPYHSFDSSVLRFIEAAALDSKVLAIKLTIYRTSAESPIIKALAEAARRGKQVAVLVEITARFDEAPNIAWGRLLENEGVHVAYGVEELKTHVKAALVVREEEGRICRYVHVGSGNYHSGTARLYEDVGVLTADSQLSADVAAVFNELTSATPYEGYQKLLVAPRAMRAAFTELIRREAEHARCGRSAGISAKMNQLQDPAIIRELYRASHAGVPISLNVRGLCCLRPCIEGISDNIRVFSVLGRYLEHGRIYRFTNDGNPQFFLGSADWMKRNLDNRVETIMPVEDPVLKKELDEILEVYELDNCSAWDLRPDGSYRQRVPPDGQQRLATQQRFIELVE